MHFLVLSACSKLPAKHRARQYQPAHSNPFHKAEVTLLMPGFSGKMADAGRAAVLPPEGDIPFLPHSFLRNPVTYSGCKE